MRYLLTGLFFAAATLQIVFADDFGPRGDVHEVRFAAQHLLASAARGWKADPKNTRIFDVVVVKDAALLSWDVGAGHGLMGLIRQNDRWWDALEYEHYLDGWIDDASYPLQEKCSVQAVPMPSAATLSDDGMPQNLITAALAHSSDLMTHAITAVKQRAPIMMDRFCGRNAGSIAPNGGTLWQIPAYTSGYDITVSYAKNDAAFGSNAQPLYARPPTAAEFLPYPTTFRFLSTAVLYFDLTIDGPAPVKFQPGTTIDIWFPFVLDDTLEYDLTIGFAGAPIGPIYAKPFDNVLHYTLPGFTATPGRTLMAEIDGDWP